MRFPVFPRLINRRTRVRKSAAFTLMEVMFAVGILFMCLFGVLALMSTNLRNARLLQQRRAIDASSVASLISVQLSNTNQISEGPVDVNLDDLYKGARCDAEITQVATNGLCDVEFHVTGAGQEVDSHFLLYLPNMKQGVISGSLPHH